MSDTLLLCDADPSPWGSYENVAGSLASLVYQEWRRLCGHFRSWEPQRCGLAPKRWCRWKPVLCLGQQLLECLVTGIPLPLLSPIGTMRTSSVSPLVLPHTQSVKQWLVCQEFRDENRDFLSLRASGVCAAGARTVARLTSCPWLSFSLVGGGIIWRLMVIEAGSDIIRSFKRI